MAKHSNRSSTKAARKHAGIQRGIGNKTAQQLQDAAAAIKAQTKRHGLGCVPKPAMAAVDNDASSIPHCMSEGRSSDLNPSTPELASPRGLSTGSFEKDGPASCASSTSEDERPVSSEPCCNNEEILDDLEELLHDQPSQDALDLPWTAQENTITMTNLLDAKVPALIHKKCTWELLSEAQEGDTAGRASASKSQEARPGHDTPGSMSNSVKMEAAAPVQMATNLVPFAGADKTCKSTGKVSFDIRVSTTAAETKPQDPSNIGQHYDLFLEHCDVDASRRSSTPVDVQLDTATQYRAIHKQVGTIFHANASMLQLEPWKGEKCTLENTLHINELPRDTAPRPSASRLREKVRQAPHQREHYDVFLEHWAVEAKGGNKLSIEEELDVATRFLRIQNQVGKPHHTHASLVPWSEQPQTIDSMLPIKNLQRDVSTRPSQHSRQAAETNSRGADAPCWNRSAPIPQMIVYPLGVHEDPTKLMDIGWTQKLPGQNKAVPRRQHQATRSNRRWQLRDLFSFGRS